MKKVSASKILPLVLIDGIKTVLYFPAWWYSKGLLKVLKGTANFIKDFEQTLGFMIWLKNLFVPMYGQRDIVGRLISFALRVVQIIVRGFVLILVILLGIIFIIIWLILPIIVIFQIFNHIF